MARWRGPGSAEEFATIGPARARGLLWAPLRSECWRTLHAPRAGVSTWRTALRRACRRNVGSFCRIPVTRTLTRGGELATRVHVVGDVLLLEGQCQTVHDGIDPQMAQCHPASAHRARGRGRHHDAYFSDGAARHLRAVYVQLSIGLRNGDGDGGGRTPGLRLELVRIVSCSKGNDGSKSSRA